MILKCENLSISYETKPVLKNLSFVVNEGDYLCIVGENGAGKTTLMRGILGLLKQNSGEIVFGKNINKNEIGYLPQQTEIQKDFPASCYEVVLSGCLNKCKVFPIYTKNHKRLVKENMKLLGISDLKNKSFCELSGGQQQRVLLARALCAADKLLVLDEPVSGLDPMVTNDFYELVKHLNKEHNITVIMVSHDILASVKYASHILHLESEKYFFATVDEYLKSDFSKRFFKSKREEE